jgi:hypothetical protein
VDGDDLIDPWFVLDELRGSVGVAQEPCLRATPPRRKPRVDLEGHLAAVSVPIDVN